MATETKNKPRVYSYIRFSTPEQKLGDSERRQLDLAKAFADEKRLTLDESLRDEGLSGYHGTHRRRGVFGKFLQRIEANEIPRGSILVVENIDRLGREDVLTALTTVTTIINHEISVVTLSPYRAEYTRQSINDGMIYQLVGDIKRANAESEMKSKRVSAARDAAFEAARTSLTIFTAKCPEWLEVRDGEFHPISEAVETIRWSYRMKIDGLSQRRIERALNEGAAWQRPSGWRTSYIKKILSNPAVIGECQPHRRGKDGKRRPDGPPIPGYYPAIIIPSETYYAVQAKLEENRGKGGRTGKRLNLLTHIARCGYCGGPMRYVDKGKTWQYLACDNAARGVCCRYLTVRYPETVEVVLSGCVYLDPRQVLPNTEEHATRSAALRQRRDGAAAELQDSERQILNFTDQIGRTKEARRRDAYEARITELEARAATLEANIIEAGRELATLEYGPKRTREWQSGVLALMSIIQDESAADTRAKLAAHLRSFIDRIEIFPHGFSTVADRAKHFHTELGELVPGRNGRRRHRPAKQWWDSTVDTIVETLDDAWDEVPPPKPTLKRWAAFEQYVLGRRMSREGRLYRVHFKTGERVDLVPPGGLGTGYSTVGETVEKILPHFDRLWQDFDGSHSEQPSA